jgi:hypothetical protein
MLKRGVKGKGMLRKGVKVKGAKGKGKKVVRVANSGGIPKHLKMGKKQRKEKIQKLQPNRAKERVGVFYQCLNVLNWNRSTFISL